MLARHFAANFVNFLIVIFVIIAGSVYWAKNQYQNEGPLESDVNFEVKKGDRFRNVSSELVFPHWLVHLPISKLDSYND